MVILHTVLAPSVKYVNIINLLKIESRKLNLEREQYYLDSLAPEYNIF